MYEKSAVQKQFPINEKKSWWSYFLFDTFCAFLLAVLFFLEFGIYVGIIFMIVMLFIAYILVTQYVQSNYFEVTDLEVIQKYTILFIPVTRRILLKNIKVINVTSFSSGLYSVILQQYFGSRYYVNRLNIVGFDYETAVALKKYIEQRMHD